MMMISEVATTGERRGNSLRRGLPASALCGVLCKELQCYATMLSKEREICRSAGVSDDESDDGARCLRVARTCARMCCSPSRTTE